MIYKVSNQKTIGSSFREQNQLIWVSQSSLQSSTSGQGTGNDLNIIFSSVIASKESQFRELYFEEHNTSHEIIL